MSTKILVVDDEQFVRDLLVKLLLRHGYEVRSAVSGEEALTRIAEDVPDLVITDVMMPGMDGFELLRSVKLRHPHVKVVVLTGYARRTSISDFLLYGADGYLSKPFQIAELIQTVERTTGTSVGS